MITRELHIVTRQDFLNPSIVVVISLYECMYVYIYIQALAGTGERIYGSLRNGTALLRVKLYDFGIYVGEAEMLEHVNQSVTNTSMMRRTPEVADASMDAAKRRGPLRFVTGLAMRPYSFLFRRRHRRRRQQSSEGGRARDETVDGAVDDRVSLSTQAGVSGKRRGSDGGNGSRRASGEKTARPLGVEEVLRHVNHDNVPLSVMYRFSRELPVDRVRKEYDAVLRRRMDKLGGDPADPDIDRLLAALSIKSVSWINEKDNYCKGTEVRTHIHTHTHIYIYILVEWANAKIHVRRIRKRTDTRRRVRTHVRKLG